MHLTRGIIKPHQMLLTSVVPPQFLVSRSICSAFSPARPYCSITSWKSEDPHLPYIIPSGLLIYSPQYRHCLSIVCKWMGNLPRRLLESPAKSCKPSNSPLCLESFELFWGLWCFPMSQLGDPPLKELLAIKLQLLASILPTGPAAGIFIVIPSGQMLLIAFGRRSILVLIL